MPTSCELEVLDITVSPTAPADTDYLLFTLPDGTSVLRDWAHVKSNSLPDDAEFTTVASGSNTNNFVSGNSQIFLTNFVGQRIRVYRGSVPQSVLQGQWGWVKSSGSLTVNPAPSTGEIWQIQAY